MCLRETSSSGATPTSCEHSLLSTLHAATPTLCEHSLFSILHAAVIGAVLCLCKHGMVFCLSGRDSAPERRPLVECPICCVSIPTSRCMPQIASLDMACNELSVFL